MKFFRVLLAIFAVSCVRANSEQCTVERVNACMKNLRTSTLETVEDLCRELLRSSSDCLKEAVDDCLGDERDSKVEDKLEGLVKLMSNCNEWYDFEVYDGNDEEMEEIEKCYEQNKDYIIECAYEGNQQALTLLMKKDDMDENTLKCKLYGMVYDCYVDRIHEKCGEKAARMADDEISEACNAVVVIDDTDIATPFIGSPKRRENKLLIYSREKTFILLM